MVEKLEGFILHICSLCLFLFFALYNPITFLHTKQAIYEILAAPLATVPGRHHLSNRRPQQNRGVWGWWNHWFHPATSSTHHSDAGRALDRSLVWAGKSFKHLQGPHRGPRLQGKGKPANKPSSYHSVAILRALSKVMEKVVLQQITPFLEDKLPECQFGFHPVRSTSAAVATAHGAWAGATSAGRVTGVTAFDLTAAFSTVDHDILCTKHQRLGILNRSIKWFRN